MTQTNAFCTSPSDRAELGANDGEKITAMDHYAVRDAGRRG